MEFQKYFTPETVSPELKKEHELNNEDRMFLINKKIDDNFLLEIYENLIEKKNYIKNENSVTINDYVFNDVEFLQDHYMNNDKSIFSKLNNCHTKIGSLLLKKLFLNPIHDINILL
jgi:DNA mismatch repair ATPase MutS